MELVAVPADQPVPTVIEYACGVTVKDALYINHPAPHHQALAHPHPHPQATTKAFTVAILFLVSIYFLHRVIDSRYIVFHILNYYKF